MTKAEEGTAVHLHAEMALKHQVNPVHAVALSQSHKALTGFLKASQVTMMNRLINTHMSDIRKLHSSTVTDLTECGDGALIHHIEMNAYLFSAGQEAAAKLRTWVEYKEEVALNFTYNTSQYKALQQYFKALDKGEQPPTRISKKVEIANSKKAKHLKS